MMVQTGSFIILVVDDDAGDQELTRRALVEGLPNADVRSVFDGEAAMDYLYHRGEFSDSQSSPTPDLVLLDLNMPRLGGREVLERLHETSELRRIPVVVLTTSQEEEDILRSYELGCNSFVTKPVEINEFIEVMTRLGLYWSDVVTLPAK
jgi:CheY-like chemotaxis protein